ncbi:MAG TPA: AAA domain-containing protein [Longimicrobiaceae bacterium]|nr:AAA domain-containing protein [Longimicrobiaceae bacterium]
MRLTGSLVAQFFRFRCERQLRYDLVPEGERNGEVPRFNDDPARGPLVGASPGAEALRRAGWRWERRRLRELVRRFGEERVRLRGWTTAGDPLRLPYPETVAALRDPGGFEYLVHPELRFPDPEGFARRWGIDPERVRIAPAQPDLIRIRRLPDGSLRFLVIDIKASRDATVAHYAQVAFYGLVLEEVCRAEGIPGVPDPRWGAVWSRGTRGPKRFPLGAYRYHVEEFLRRDLPRVAALAPREAAWHVAPGCASCAYFHLCRDEADRTDDLARIPGMTPLARQVLREWGIRTVRELATSFRRDTYTGCHALESDAPRLKQRAQALRFGKTFDVERETHLMGAGEGTRVVLSADEDPVTGTCFALGIRAAGAGVDSRGSARAFLAEAGTRAAERAMLLGFLAHLDGVIADALAAPSGPTGGTGRRSGGASSLHFFVYDRDELALLRAVLERHLGDPALHPAIARALGVLFPVDEASGSRPLRASPGTVLADAVAALFALPVPYTYDLASVSDALRPSEMPHVFAPPPGLTRPLSGRVSFERAHEAWHRGPVRDGEPTPEEAREALRAAVESRLAAADSVLRAVRERAERRGASRLRLEAEPLLPGESAEPIPHPLLEALRVFTRVEAAAEAVAIRALHTRPAAERAAHFECIRGMELAERLPDGKLVFEFDPECRDAKFKPGDFTLVLTNEGTDTLLEADRNPWLRRQLAAELVEYDLSVSPPRVVLAPGDPKGLERAEQDGKLFLDRVCTLDRAPGDFSTRRILATLRALAVGEGEAGFVLALLEGRVPEGWLPPGADVEAVRREVLAPAETVYRRPVLNPDQERAWRAAFERPVSLVWGPPGTGKTYLLAWMLVGLAAAARREGRPCRILVSAATHRAIVNVLVRVARELEATRIPSPLRAVKLQGSGSEADAELAGTPVELVPDGRLPALLAEAEGGEPLVVGSTVWSLWKQMRAARARNGEGEGGGEAPVRPWFDVVVIDESSQMKVTEALIALSSIRARGQVILCGDDRQLAPVIRGRYGAGNDSLFGSVFARFAGFFPRLTLRESRRMNRALVEYPRELFYPGLVSMCPEERIRCADHGAPADELDALLRDLFFRPEDAVVLCTYSGFRAGARNPFEARLAARLARLARAALLDPDTGERFTPERFVSRALAVLSPHRAQNSAIYAEMLEAGLARGELPVVDTVERMQGNEREMVIVSYAVADGEYAEREAEFLLNPNRFNVAITRPRGKLVVLMSEAVLAVLPRDEEVMTGSLAIKGYGRHCADGEREVELPAPDGRPVPVRCRYRRLG